ncbi:protein kinase [Actinoplanes sp. NPDC051494]|uniref:protein kinase domain-containing protein n=1 Tax=Actinoplanes sp. NPDC051494 TaxID=3363907 RepID=UPI0037A6F560
MDTAGRVRPLTPLDPRQLGEYQLLGRLGSGGMGVVYLAENGDGTPVAVKLVHAALMEEAEFRARFRSEVERAREVPPFCTAEVLDADLDHVPPYVVFEYVDGPDLAEVVENRGPLRAAALQSLAVGVATALRGIHGAGVIHRDLKPENVLLALGSPKVIDFGIARAFDPTSRYTGTDDLVGTVAYMAPERFTDDPDTDPATAASDVFAWGCVVTYAGLGRTPFRGDSPAATAGRILTQEPQLDGLPPALREVVARSLDKDPTARPSARALVDMLLGDHPAPAAVAPSPVSTPAAATPAAATPGPVAAPGAPAPAAPPRSARPALSPPGGPVAAPPAAAPAPRRPDRPARRRLLVGAVAVALVGGAAGTAIAASRTDETTAGSATASTAGTIDGGPLTSSGSPVAEQTTLSPEPSRSARPPAAGDRPSGKPTASSAKPSSKKPSAGASAKAGPAASANPGGRNLALDATVTASSSEGDPWAPANAVDGDTTTRWGSGFSDPQWLIVDLGARWQISEVQLRWENAYGVAYRVEVSADKKKWTPVYRTTAGTGGTVSIDADKASGRYVRVYGTKRINQYGYSLYEVEIR